MVSHLSETQTKGVLNFAHMNKSVNKISAKYCKRREVAHFNIHIVNSKTKWQFLNLYNFFFFLMIQFQDYFTHIETSQSVGGAKREYPGKTT